MISQNQNKLIRSLHQKKFREQHSLFIIEGVRSIKEAINTNAQFEIGISTESFSEKNSDLIRAINPEIVSEEDIKRLSPSVTPSGVLAVYKIPQFNKPNLDQNFIYLDHVADPGNMGTILRTATWFGINQIILSEGCTDPFNPKVVRSAMGAHFHLSWIGHLDLNTLNNHLIIGADSRGSTIDTFNSFSEKWCLVMGSEAHGISGNIISVLDKTVAIPMHGIGESLNIGVAMGVFLHHLTKQPVVSQCQ